MIVRTVLDNSIRQLSVAQREARRSGATIPREQLFCRISLDVVPSAGGVTMQLVVWDSGGGFPADLLPKVYVEPIPSSKEANRMGEGSHGVGVWVRLFDGAIRASNEVLGERLGARTEMNWSASAAPTSLSSSTEDGPS
jgi:DNA topoisomerase VI subunit B